MSRSGYTSDGDFPIALWKQIVSNSIKGKRGQNALKELLVALDAMPVKELIAEEFEYSGQFCTLGVLCHAKGIDTCTIDPEDCDHADNVASEINIAPCLVREVEYQNDECGPYQETPEQRWVRMRRWVAAQIKQ